MLFKNSLQYGVPGLYFPFRRHALLLQHIGAAMITATDVVIRLLQVHLHQNAKSDMGLSFGIFGLKDLQIVSNCMIISEG